MEQISSIRDLVGLWPTRAAFAAATGVPLERVHKWVSADAIPARHWRAVLIAAREIEAHCVTAERLVELHAPRASEDAA